MAYKINFQHPLCMFCNPCLDNGWHFVIKWNNINEKLVDEKNFQHWSWVGFVCFFLPKKWEERNFCRGGNENFCDIFRVLKNSHFCGFSRFLFSGDFFWRFWNFWERFSNRNEPLSNLYLKIKKSRKCMKIVDFKALFRLNWAS